GGEAGFEADLLRRRHRTGEGHLATGLDQDVVQQVQLFLTAVLACQRVDIIDQQSIDPAQSMTPSGYGAIAKRGYQAGYEGPSVQHRDAAETMLLQRQTEGVEEMSLALATSADQNHGVVAAARRSGGS